MAADERFQKLEQEKAARRAAVLKEAERVRKILEQRRRERECK